MKPFIFFLSQSHSLSRQIGLRRSKPPIIFFLSLFQPTAAHKNQDSRSMPHGHQGLTATTATTYLYLIFKTETDFIPFLEWLHQTLFLNKSLISQPNLTSSSLG
ncbi:hypothetical protein Dimus_021587 [Dionaea muscipula]